MIKILKFAKKSWYWIVLIIALLFVQAACDLSLPQYTSDIVDVGIQNGGISESIPKAMTETTYNEIKLFMEDEAQLDNYYDYLDYAETDGAEKDEYLAKYPEWKHQNIYVLNFDMEEEKEKEEELSELLQIPAAMYTMMVSETDKEDTDIENTMDMDAMKEQMAVMLGNPDIRNMEMKELLPLLPKEVRMDMVSSAEEKLSQMEGLVGDSVSVAFVKAAYEELGMDMEKLQMDYLSHVGLKMLLLAFLGMIVAITVTLIASRVAAVTSKNLRDRTFEKVVGFSTAEMNNFSTASLITRCTNDTDGFRNAASNRGICTDSGYRRSN